jgi:hypothetical protein
MSSVSAPAAPAATTSRNPYDSVCEINSLVFKTSNLLSARPHLVPTTTTTTGEMPADQKKPRHGHGVYCKIKQWFKKKVGRGAAGKEEEVVVEGRSASADGYIEMPSGSGTPFLLLAEKKQYML